MYQYTRLKYPKNVLMYQPTSNLHMISEISHSPTLTVTYILTRFYQRVCYARYYSSIIQHEYQFYHHTSLL